MNFNKTEKGGGCSRKRTGYEDTNSEKYVEGQKCFQNAGKGSVRGSERRGDKKRSGDCSDTKTNRWLHLQAYVKSYPLTADEVIESVSKNTGDINVKIGLDAIHPPINVSISSPGKSPVEIEAQIKALIQEYWVSIIPQVVKDLSSIFQKYNETREVPCSFQHSVEAGCKPDLQRNQVDY